MERQQSSKMLGYRAGIYRAFVGGRIVAVAETLADVQEQVAEAAREGEA